MSGFNYDDKPRNVTQDLVKQSLGIIKDQYLTLENEAFEALQNTNLLQRNLTTTEGKRC